jgi:hypothetical protein
VVVNKDSMMGIGSKAIQVDPVFKYSVQVDRSACTPRKIERKTEKSKAIIIDINMKAKWCLLPRVYDRRVNYCKQH